MKTLVLGLGNDLFGDDGVGLHLVRLLKKELLGDEEGEEAIATPGGSLDLVASSSTGLALLDLIIGYDRLFIIDTIKRASPETGRVYVLKEEDIRAIPGPSPHYVSLPQVVALGRRAGLQVPQEILIIAIEAKDIYRLGEGLSPEMEARLPALLSLVKSLLNLRPTDDEPQRDNYS